MLSFGTAIYLRIKASSNEIRVRERHVLGDRKAVSSILAALACQPHVLDVLSDLCRDQGPPDEESTAYVPSLERQLYR